MIACDDNGNHAVLVEDSISYPAGLAVDWIHGLLFWTDLYLGTINVMDLNTKQRKVLFNIDLIQPQDIAVDPSKGLIFWIHGNEKAIERASMDGNDRMTIAKSRWPDSLALDIFNERVYWANGDRNTIASVDYNGNDLRTILNPVSIYPSSLAIFEEKLYWVDQWVVLVMNIFNGTEVRKLINGVDNTYSQNTLRVYHDAAQPVLPNKCDQHSCGDGAICLPKGNS
uniref:Uncharacterized protein n=1 Tax=Acrobeloides nanus TaxID=290746 RepID=A0A914CSD7_9BILA